MTALLFAAGGGALAIPAVTLAPTAHAAGLDTPRVQPKLVALGDSYTSGTGNTPYVDGTATDGCDRSAAAYPNVAAKTLGYAVTSVACSGATTSSLTASFKTEAPQLDAVAGADYVVMTMGGNDVSAWSTLARIGAPGTLDDFQREVQALGPRLVTAYQSVKKTEPSAKVYVLGYPDIFPATQADLHSCVGVLANAVSVPSIHSALTSLNTAVRTSALAAGVDYVDTTNAFAGHQICTDDPWAYGLTFSGFSASGTLHPTPAGHDAIAAKLVSAIKAGGATAATTTTAVRKPTTTTSAAKPSTTTTTTKSTTTTAVVQPAVTTTTVKPIRTTTSSTTTSSTTTTSTTAAPVVGGTDEPQVLGESIEGDQAADAVASNSATAAASTQASLAYTGASVAGKLSVAFLLAGFGLLLVWLQLTRMDRARSRA